MKTENELKKINLCRRCKHGYLYNWNYNKYARYMGCPYSSHSHYPRKECVFYEKGNIPFCPQHKCDMKSHGTHGDITIYRCPGETFDHLDKDWKPCGTQHCSREVWVHKNGLKRFVERGSIDIKSKIAKELLDNGFDIIESTKVENWE